MCGGGCGHSAWDPRAFSQNSYAFYLLFKVLFRFQFLGTAIPGLPGDFGQSKSGAAAGMSPPQECGRLRSTEMAAPPAGSMIPGPTAGPLWGAEMPPEPPRAPRRRPEPPRAPRAAQRRSQSGLGGHLGPTWRPRGPRRPSGGHFDPPRSSILEPSAAVLNFEASAASSAAFRGALSLSSGSFPTTAPRSPKS